MQREGGVTCNCTRSHCLKMYCACFAVGVLCLDCLCVGCANDSDNRQRSEAIHAIVDKDPLAFSKGVIQSRCSCQKSKCQKKYCECFKANIQCTQECNCIDCLNQDPQSENLFSNKKIKK